MFRIETGYDSINKCGEELCGDRVEIISREDAVTMVLADGLGSGVKANILSTLTSKILCTMISNGMNIEEAVQTVAHTLPVCSERQIAYSTFSVLHIDSEGEASLIQYDNPEAVYMHGGKCSGYPVSQKQVYGKQLLESRFRLREGDRIVLLSDGVVHAGAGKIYNLGWQHENVCEYLNENSAEGDTARVLAARLTGACRQLYVDRPGDDATVAVARLRACKPVNVLIGPPRDPKDLNEMLREFLDAPGERAACGGTTSRLLADYLGEELVPELETIDRRVPPTASIKGIGLVTEGVLTISRALELLGEYRKPSGGDGGRFEGRDGASRLLRLLAEDCTDVRFFVGTAVNPAYSDPSFPLKLAFKPRLVEELAQGLQDMGKIVSLRFY